MSDEPVPHNTRHASQPSSMLSPYLISGKFSSGQFRNSPLKFENKNVIFTQSNDGQLYSLANLTLGKP